MSVSASVRAALSMAKKRQVDIAALWETSPQVIANKFRLERWTGEELARIAALTGGKLAFVYPDGQQIYIPSSEAGRETKAPGKAKKPKQPKAPAGREPAPKLAAKKAKAPAKPKAEKIKKPLEEQLSMFDLEADGTI